MDEQEGRKFRWRKMSNRRRKGRRGAGGKKWRHRRKRKMKERNGCRVTVEGGSGGQGERSGCERRNGRQMVEKD